MFVTSRLTYNNEILSQCIQFVEAVSTKNQIFLTGAVESGKSTFLTLISNPKTQPTIVLHKINPNAYTM